MIHCTHIGEKNTHPTICTPSSHAGNTYHDYDSPKSSMMSIKCFTAHAAEVATFPASSHHISRSSCKQSNDLILEYPTSICQNYTTYYSFINLHRCDRFLPKIMPFPMVYLSQKSVMSDPTSTRSVWRDGAIPVKVEDITSLEVPTLR